MRILIVDDHPLIVQALERSLPQLDPRLEVIGAVNRDEALIALARHPECALVLLDLALPGARGLDLLAELRADHPRLPIVVLSATHDRATVGAALAAGARGYVSKTARSDALLDAVRTVLSGGRDVTANIVAAPITALAGIPLPGLGLTQRQGGPVEEIRPGDTIWFAPGEKHWHGASAATAMSHLAIQEALDGKAVEWLEHVSDADYGGKAG